jgi:transposase-like protein
MALKAELLDELVAHGQGKSGQWMLSEKGLMGELRRALAERLLRAELTHHLAQEARVPQAAQPPVQGTSADAAAPDRSAVPPAVQTTVAIKRNSRNGFTPKTVRSEHGDMTLAIPRDRLGSFEPQVIAKYQRRMTGFDDNVISLYARGMTTREITGHLLDIYGMEVSPELISTITNEVMDEVRAWQNRPLEAVYPVVYFDALRVSIRDEQTVRKKAIYLALGVAPDGRKSVLGAWIEQTEGAKFWLKVMTDLKTRGVNDILIAVVDGLNGFPEAINTAFPQTQVQTCIVHLIRNSLAFCAWKDRKAMAGALKTIYQAPNADAAHEALLAFGESDWGRKFPSIVKSWQRHWEEVIPFFAYPPEVRRILYTTNAIESLHMRLRKTMKSRGQFPSDDAALKLIFLNLRNIEKEWKMPAIIWAAAKSSFAILFGERFTDALK